MSLRTPLARARGLGSSKSGTTHWWLQRVTSVAALPLIVFLIIFIGAHLNADRARLIAAFHNPVVSALIGLGIVTVLWHMKLGMQVIIEDYVHSPAAKLAVLLLNIFFCFALGAFALLAIVKLSFS